MRRPRLLRPILAATFVRAMAAVADPAAQPVPPAATPALPAEPAPDAAAPVPVVPKSSLRIDQAAWNPLSLVVHDQGLAEAALGPDIKLTQQPLEDTARVVAGLAAGSLDVGSLSTVAALAARASGIKIRIVAYVAKPEWSGLLAGKDSGAGGADDLKGKRVAVRGAEARLFLDRALASAGLGERDIVLVPLHRLSARMALDRAQVEFWVADDPDRAAAETEAGDRPLRRAEEPGPEAVLCAREAFLAAHPDEVAALLKAYDKARVWALSHPAELARLVGAAATISPTAAAVALARTDLAAAPLDDTMRRHLVTMAGWLKETGRLGPDLDAERLAGDLTDPIWWRLPPAP